MNFFARLLLLSAMLFFSFSLIGFSSIQTTRHLGNPVCSVKAGTLSQNTVDLESDQSFSGAAGSTVEYNVYVWNKGKSASTYELTVSSSQAYYIEVWRDTDQLGNGDLRILPPQGSTITMKADEVATLIVRVTISSDATDGTIDNTVIRATSADSGTSDSVSLVTKVDFDLSYPSDWIQLGSDPTFPSPPPVRIDIKAFYNTNNGTHIFFRLAEVSKPNTIAFLYSVYLDVRAGGQQIDKYNYDYLLRSDGILYEWNGATWVNSGYPTYWQVDGTAIVIWTDLSTLPMDTQEIHFLAYTTTKDGISKDKMGPYTILKNNISEIPLILIPVLSFAVFLAILRRTKKNALAPKHNI